ncbi:MAG: nuclear transport factor 2 family protein [Eubacteriaceae bacterium]|nr:nuclear transport factor 2 family protein [Eubacteriaceae bacterium]
MDRKEIETVIQSFFDADYERDADKMEAVFHEGSEFFELGKDGVLVKRSGKEFAGGMRRFAGIQADYPRAEEILSIEFTGENTAVARTRMRVRNTLFTDILCLMRLDGKWGIIAKIASGVPIG